MDYGDILHHQLYNEVINSKLECIQYNTTFAITGAIKGTSGSKLYKELGLGSWRSWRTTTLRCPCAFHKIVSTHLLSYFFNLIPHSQGSQQSVKSLKSGNCQGIWDCIRDFPLQSGNFQRWICPVCVWVWDMEMFLNLGWLWFSFSLNFLGKWLSLESLRLWILLNLLVSCGN